VVCWAGGTSYQWPTNCSTRDRLAEIFGQHARHLLAEAGRWRSAAAK
jgi:hypothetical protein